MTHFVEALHRFKHDLQKHYGPHADDVVVKIGLERKFYEKVVFEMMNVSFTKGHSYGVLDLAEPKILDVTILPRDKGKEF